MSADDGGEAGAVPSAPARIEAYGEGGFRIGGVRHEGSVLILNGVVTPWAPHALQDVQPSAFDPVFAAEPAADLVLFGVGLRMAAPPEAVMARFREAAVGLEFMDTAAACRLHATLLAEGRRVAAALLAV